MRNLLFVAVSLFFQLLLLHMQHRLFCVAFKASRSSIVCVYTAKWVKALFGIILFFSAFLLHFCTYLGVKNAFVRLMGHIVELSTVCSRNRILVASSCNLNSVFRIFLSPIILALSVLNSQVTSNLKFTDESKH